MTDVHILIPLKSNTGKRFSANKIGEFEEFAMEQFNGISGPILPAVPGKWRDEGTVYRDQNTTYIVAVAGLLAEAAKLLEVVEFAKQNFSQKAIMVRYLGQSEIL